MFWNLYFLFLFSSNFFIRNRTIFSDGTLDVIFLQVQVKNLEIRSILEIRFLLKSCMFLLLFLFCFVLYCFCFACFFFSLLFIYLLVWRILLSTLLIFKIYPIISLYCTNHCTEWTILVIGKLLQITKFVLLLYFLTPLIWLFCLVLCFQSYLKTR